MGQPTTTKQHLESVHLQVAWLTSKIDGAGLIQIPKAYVARELAAKTLIGVLGDCVQPKFDRFFGKAINYEDPDGNIVEINVNNYGSEKSCNDT